MNINPYPFYAFLFFFFVSSAWAAEIRVSPGGGTLAAAVAAASDGDTLVLEDGGFSGSVTVSKSLIIRPVNRATIAVVTDTLTISGSGIEVTVQGLRFSADVSLTAAAAVRLLENVWLSDDIEGSNYRTSQGDGSLVIVGNRFASGSDINKVYSEGAYIAGNILLGGWIETYVYVWIVGNELFSIDNNNFSGQSVIYANGSGAVAYILANRVQCNTRAETKCIQANSTSTLIAGNVVEVADTLLAFNYDNPEHGIYAGGSGHATVINNVVRGLPNPTNRSGGSPIWVTAPSARVAGNIIIDYVSGPGTPGAITPITVTSASAQVTHNLCFNNGGTCPTGDGNLNADPLFIDLDDYQLATGSPAIDAGAPDPGMADLDRTRNDMGPQGGPWSIAQYDAQRDPDNYAPYVYPLFNIDSILSGGILEIQALGVARLR